MASLSPFWDVWFWSLRFSSVYLPLHLYILHLYIKVASSIGVLKSRKKIRLMVMAKLKPLFNPDFSKAVRWRLLILIMIFTSE